MSVYEHVMNFKNKYPGTIAWRIKKHCDVIDKYLNPDEVVSYAFVAQKNHHSYEIFRTFAIAITNKRIIIAQKRLLFGYLFISITPEMYNDIKLTSLIIWGKVIIDTIKEKVILSNIDKNALPEIETQISQPMMAMKAASERNTTQTVEA